MKLIKRHISQFEKNSDVLFQEIEFTVPPDLTLLQNLFNLSADNPMYDEYPITKEIALKISPLIKKPLNLEKYEYFLSCSYE